MKKNLPQQQYARAEVEEILWISLAEIKKIMSKHTLYRETAEDDKASLLKHVENDEGQLKLVTEELTCVKGHISKMTSVVFGKYFVCCQLQPL